MRYKTDIKKGQPAYLQIYTQLREDITNGFYRFGSRMPSKRLLAEETGTSVITIEHAYGLLAEEGYVEPRERSGYFVSYMEHDSFSYPKETVRRVHTGEMLPADFTEGMFPFSVFARTMRRVLAGYGERILVQSDNIGAPELRSEIASYLHRSRGMTVSPQQILIGSGAEYLYGLVVQMLGRNRIFALEAPCYEKIRQVYEANGVFCEHLELGSTGIRSDELKNSKASVLHVTPFNSYPSGITATAAKRREYISWAKKRNALLIEDDYASEFTDLTKAEDTLFSMEPEQTVIYMNTFSKTIAPSMRMGYMVLPNRLCEALRDSIGFYACTVPVFEQYVLAEFIRNGDFERHINRLRRKRRMHLQGVK